MSPLQGFSAISNYLLHTRASTLLDYELPIAAGLCPRPKETTKRGFSSIAQPVSCSGSP